MRVTQWRQAGCKEDSIMSTQTPLLETGITVTATATAADELLIKIRQAYILI